MLASVLKYMVSEAVSIPQKELPRFLPHSTNLIGFLPFRNGWAHTYTHLAWNTPFLPESAHGFRALKGHEGGTGTTRGVT